jgi:hypothetical protein
MSFMIVPERPSRSYLMGKATASAMRLRISEEMTKAGQTGMTLTKTVY